jgi:hypothetical protein
MPEQLLKARAGQWQVHFPPRGTSQLNFPTQRRDHPPIRNAEWKSGRAWPQPKLTSADELHLQVAVAAAIDSSSLLRGVIFFRFWS